MSVQFSLFSFSVLDEEFFQSSGSKYTPIALQLEIDECLAAEISLQKWYADHEIEVNARYQCGLGWRFGDQLLLIYVFWALCWMSVQFSPFSFSVVNEEEFF